jgi:hypothetical protein
MTFKFGRYDIEPIDFGTNGTMRINRDDGEYVLAEDAINREAVNEAKIRTLEVQLKDARLALHRVQGHLVRKNRALVEVKNIVQATFSSDE